MRRPQTKDLAVYALVILAGVQLSVLGIRMAHPHQVPLVWPQVGDTISGVRIQLSKDRETQVPSGDSTVLLIFDSQCVHCAKVAPLWKDWLRAEGRDWRVLAVAAECLESAQRYAEEQGWEVQVGAVEAEPSGEMAAALMGRAPWVFVANGAGVILAEGHGDMLPELINGVEPHANRLPVP